ncbi:hypothetical protein NP493_818g01015 [Ridgeia piscesae]|uniref:Uncharacterized protein n=1 Tax=Ridgeia piscesae TaxID=27915 RepID=A0AAD9KP01_RIDPI|nr:hypothetical protein NP493_818g01015 [Ridgeia piscesae]
MTSSSSNRSLSDHWVMRIRSSLMTSSCASVRPRDGVRRNRALEHCDGARPSRDGPSSLQGESTLLQATPPSFASPLLRRCPSESTRESSCPPTSGPLGMSPPSVY